MPVHVPVPVAVPVAPPPIYAPEPVAPPPIYAAGPEYLGDVPYEGAYGGDPYDYKKK